MITVAIIEDNRMVRDGLRTMLDQLADVAVVFATDSACQRAGSGVARHATSTVSNGADHSAALEFLDQLRPRVLLLNVGLAHPDNLGIVRRVRTSMRECDVVVMDLLPEHGGIAQLVNEGVAGFILKDATFEEFSETIRSVALGGSVLPPRMIGTLFSQLANMSATHRETERSEPANLTPREIEVIALIAQGRSNKEIALQLTVAAHTVKTHVRNVMEKLALNTRLQIAAYAHRHLS